MLLVAVVTPDSSRRYNAPLTLPSCEDKIPRDLLLIYLFFECVFFLRRYSHHDQCNQRVCKLQVHDRPANSSTTLILVIVIFHPSRTICIVLQFFVYVIDEPPPHCEDRHAMLFLCSRDESKLDLSYQDGYLDFVWVFSLWKKCGVTCYVSFLYSMLLSSSSSAQFS